MGKQSAKPRVHEMAKMYAQRFAREQLALLMTDTGNKFLAWSSNRWLWKYYTYLNFLSESCLYIINIIDVVSLN